MAKDGTQRGGARPGAGRKPKALKEKLLEGRINSPETHLRFPGDGLPSYRERTCRLSMTT